MAKAFGLQTPMGSIVAVANSREDMQQIIDSNVLLSFASDVIELEVNTEPMTERGHAIQEQIRKIWKEKQIINFRFDKGPSWFAMHADDRAQLVLDLLTIEEEDNTPLDFGDEID